MIQFLFNIIFVLVSPERLLSLVIGVLSRFGHVERMSESRLTKVFIRQM